MNNRGKEIPVCSRIGCSARINVMKGSRGGSLDKAKSARPLFRPSSNGKEIDGSSSRAFFAVGDARKSSANTSRRLSSLLETDSSETSGVHAEAEAPEPIPLTRKIKRGVSACSENSDSRQVVTTEAGSSGLGSSTRTRRSSHQRSGLSNQGTPVGSSLSLSFNNSRQSARGNLSKSSLRNLRCSSISDVAVSGSSSSDSSLSRKKDMFKKRNSDGESSSTDKGRKMNGSPVEVRNQNSSLSVSISDARRNGCSNSNVGNGVSSVGTRRSINFNSRMRRSNQGTGNNESPVAITEVPQPEILVDPNPPLSTEISFRPSGSYSRLDSGSGQLNSSMPGSPSEAGITRSLINRDGFRRHNMDGIAEVLLALERIEQDEELTYEQLLVLETNSFFRGLNLYDQHRDMRLDIDDMSYEELLALEERMGTVSTALSEEALSKCLKTSIYQVKPLEYDTGSSCQTKEDVKCSICQEEYKEGEEVGRLHCEHVYHVGCIQQWLRIKNWCPICKLSAESSQPHPSS